MEIHIIWLLHFNVYQIVKYFNNYFIYDYYIQFINRINPISSKGKIVESYAELINHLWYGEKKIIELDRLKNECGMVRNMFAGYNQQDAQEFISFLLDELHEDLNKVLIKPYIEKDDNLVFGSDIEECIYIFLARNQSIIVEFFDEYLNPVLFVQIKIIKIFLNLIILILLLVFL